MARKKKKKHEEMKSNFDMLFLQLMMIMMAFFILLSAMSVIIEEKRMKAMNSIHMAFNQMPGGASLNPGSGGPVANRNVAVSNASSRITAKKLTNVAKLLGVGKSMDVLPLDKSTVRIRMQDKILFESGQIKLSPKVRALIASIAEILRQPEIQDITIEGHTDRMPQRGEIAVDNWELSAARAMQIFLELAKNDIPKSKLVASGMGDTQPRPVSETNGNEALNRRVELLIRFRPTTTEDAELTTTDSYTPTSGVSSGGN